MDDISNILPRQQFVLVFLHFIKYNDRVLTDTPQCKSS